MGAEDRPVSAPVQPHTPIEQPQEPVYESPGVTDAWDTGGDPNQITATPVKTSQQLNNPTWEESHPEFQYPNPITEGRPLNTLQSAQNAFARKKYERDHLENQDHGVKGVLKEILSNFFEGLKQAKPGMGWKESLLLGGAGAGAGALNRTWNERRELDKLIPDLEKNVGQETQNALRNEQRQNYDTDNQFQRDRLIQQGQLAGDKAANSALTKLYSGKIFDPKNPAHIAMAKAARLDPTQMKAWDFSNPAQAKVNGQPFDYNRVTGEWDPSGLPESEKDKIVPVEFAVPGETNVDGTQKIRKFNVPQDRAASFVKDLQVAGVQADLARQRIAQGERRLALDEKQFGESQKQFQMTFGLRQKTFEAMEAARAKGDEVTAQKYQLELEKHDADLGKMRLAASKALTAGELTQSQYDNLMQTLQPASAGLMGAPGKVPK